MRGRGGHPDEGIIAILKENPAARRSTGSALGRDERPDASPPTSAVATTRAVELMKPPARSATVVPRSQSGPKAAATGTGFCRDDGRRRKHDTFGVTAD
jgi:hypothetical protein